jgi:hypothetical protein
MLTASMAQSNCPTLYRYGTMMAQYLSKLTDKRFDRVVQIPQAKYYAEFLQQRGFAGITKFLRTFIKSFVH